jgi:hypothetical protein
MGKKPRVRPPKNPNILAIARKAVAEGSYTPVDHAKLRLDQREVTVLEMEQAIARGYHETRKDEYKTEHKCWNYSIRGKTVDARELRVAVSLDKNSGLLIVTVIDLAK